MRTSNIKCGKELGLSLSDCHSLMKHRVYQYRVAGQAIYDKGWYSRGRSYHPVDGGRSGAVDTYVMTTTNEVIQILQNTTRHRAYISLNAYLSGKLSDVDASIWNNYITNGYNTRIGLFRSNSRIDRIKKIERSHADYLGNESGCSSIDHERRVAMRI